MPEWAQGAANIGLALVATAAGAYGYFQTKAKKGSDEDLTVLGIEDVTSNRVVKKFLETQTSTNTALLSIAADIKLLVAHLIEKDRDAEMEAKIERRAREMAGDREPRAGGQRKATAQGGG